jgi:hypothetical protein
MSRKVKIYLTVFILVVALPLVLTSCKAFGVDVDTCCGGFAFIGIPLMLMKI